MEPQLRTAFLQTLMSSKRLEIKERIQTQTLTFWTFLQKTLLIYNRFSWSL